ncbi:hypothetical protein AXG93_1474s1290 [Marchantia polymorpha subsp. ruderalis]|uniref:Uncharacterized protein n=1 Tax=Marchantia polymorpha subsp. ruderalis TaxID=1480154 RepID=A0A176WBR4_MARPO|nr:hypothetical protein AXG93_1474s1290 [Marchantia polymorpha subsp. ruderalis]
MEAEAEAEGSSSRTGVDQVRRRPDRHERDAPSSPSSRAGTLNTQEDKAGVRDITMASCDGIRSQDKQFAASSSGKERTVWLDSGAHVDTMISGVKSRASAISHPALKPTRLTEGSLVRNLTAYGMVKSGCASEGL